MAQETLQLAKYAAALRYDELPAAVIQRAKDTIADTIAAIAFGAHLPWSRIVVDYARRRGAGGKSRVFAPAGSRSCGLLEFARSGTGAMVKRLHLGRAAESGVLAASLAEAGFTGPHSVLEGPFGFLNVYCGDNDMAALTRGLGAEWATLRIMLKRFPVHITSHTSVQAVEDLGREHGYDAADVASIHIAGNQKMATVNNIPAPADLMMAQYSLPFCVALAHHRDPRDPASFNAKSFNDPAILALAQRVTITVADEAKH